PGGTRLVVGAQRESHATAGSGRVATAGSRRVAAADSAISASGAAEPAAGSASAAPCRPACQARETYRQKPDGARVPLMRPLLMFLLLTRIAAADKRQGAS